VGEKTRICLCFWRIIPEIDLILAQLRIAFLIIFAILTFIHWTHPLDQKRTTESMPVALLHL
jgi:hypothetical protein